MNVTVTLTQPTGMQGIRLGIEISAKDYHS